MRHRAGPCPRPPGHSRRLHRARWLVLAGAASALLASPAQSLGAVTIGSDLTSDPGASRLCSPSGTWVQYDVSGTQPITAPSDGVVVRYRLETSSALDVRLRILRSAGMGGTFTALGSSAVATAAVGVNTFDTRLPIGAGSQLGIDQVAAGQSLGAFAIVGSAGSDAFSPALSDGETRSAGGCEASGGNPRELLLNADIEPDADRDAYGDETQDRCATNGATQGRCTPPALISVGISRRRFAPTRVPTPLTGTATRAPRGTVFAFELDEPGNVEIRMDRRLAGRRVGGKCRAVTRRNRKRRRCARYATRGALTRSAPVGLRFVPFSGLLEGRARPLRRGRYRAVFTPSDAAGVGVARAVRFRIVKR